MKSSFAIFIAECRTLRLTACYPLSKAYNGKPAKAQDTRTCFFRLPAKNKLDDRRLRKPRATVAEALCIKSSRRSRADLGAPLKTVFVSLSTSQILQTSWRVIKRHKKSAQSTRASRIRLLYLCSFDLVWGSRFGLLC